MSLAANAAARLIAVVVFPTPPFWLAIARTRLKRSGYHAVSRETKSGRSVGTKPIFSGARKGQIQRRGAEKR